MPAMEDVVGNLGESLDFGEYRADGDSSELHPSAQIDGTDPDIEWSGMEDALGPTLVDAEVAEPSSSREQ